MTNHEGKIVELTESYDSEDVSYATAVRQLADTLRLRESHLVVLPLRPYILRTLVYLPPGWGLHMIGNRACPSESDGVMHMPHSGPLMVTRLYPMMIEMAGEGERAGDRNMFIPFGILTIPDSMDTSRWCRLVGFQDGPFSALVQQVVVPAVDGPSEDGICVPALAVDALAAAYPDEVADIWGSVTTERPTGRS